MEDDDDEENFESLVYGQGETNQDAKKNRLCYLVRNNRTGKQKTHACARRHQTRGWRPQSTEPWRLRRSEMIFPSSYPRDGAHGQRQRPL